MSRAAGTRRRSVRPVRLVRFAAVGLCVGACTDLLLVEPAAPPAGIALSYTAVGDPSVRGGPGAAFDQADRFQLRLFRVETLVLDTTVNFDPDSAETRLQLEVDLVGERESLALTAELGRGDDLLFWSAAIVDLERGAITTAVLELEPAVAGARVPDAVPVITAIGDTVQLEGAAVFATGDTIPDLALVWSSSNEDVAEVNGGEVVALAEGMAQIRGRYSSFRDSVQVQVAAIVDTVTIEPDSASVPLEFDAQLTATPRDRRGNALFGRSVLWSSSDTIVATVDSTGLVVARDTGTATIFAESEGVIGSAKVTVPYPNYLGLRPGARATAVQTPAPGLDP